MKRELTEEKIFTHYIKFLECQLANGGIFDLVDEMREKKIHISKKSVIEYVEKTLNEQLSSQMEITEFKSKEIAKMSKRIANRLENILWEFLNKEPEEE